MRQHRIAALAAALGLVAVVIQGPQQPAADLTARVADLEKRVATLEQFHKAPAAAAAPLAEGRPAAGEFLVPIVITNKRFDNSQIQNYVWWDATYDFAKLPKAARAIKGIVEFCDLFDAPKFQINVTITDPVPAGGKHRAEGVGFRYNQFMAPHQWMLSTNLEDMHVVFRVKQVIYADGTRAEF